MRYFIFLSILFTALSIQAREVELSWEPFENTLGYHVFISKTSDFKEIVFKKGVKDPKITVKLDMGTYFYKVRAVDKDKQPGHWSEPMKFSVTPYPPELKAPKNDVDFGYFEIPPKIDFEWKAAEDDPEYEIFVYKTTGQKVLEKRAKSTHITIDSLTEGEYLWKIRTIYKGIYESPYCEPRRFNVEKREMLKPVILAPANESSVPAYQSVQLEWQKDPVTKFSEIEMYFIDDDNKEKKKINIPSDLSGDKYTLDHLEPGDYTWVVKTKEGEKTPGLLSESSSFQARKDIISDGNFNFWYGLGAVSLNQEFISTRAGPKQTGKSEDSSWSHHFMGNYFFSQGYGLQLNMAYTQLTQSNSDLPHLSWTLTNRFRMGTPGFNQHFLLGYRQQNIYEVIEQGYQLYTTNGLIVGTQLNGTIDRKYRLEIEALYYKPLSHQESRAKFTGDVYEGTVSLNYNFSYKFWVGYEFKYQKGVYNIIPTGNPDSVYTKWSTTVMTPIMIKIGFEN